MSEGERRDRLRLIRSEHVGPVTFRRLLERYGSASTALLALPELAGRSGQSARVCSIADAEAEMLRVDRLGARLVVFGDAAYPAPLAAVEDAPASFCVLGDARLLQRPAVAVVGSRNASLVGRRMAAALATELGSAGYVVVSGLARGIDGEAHRAALATGTVAVLASGIDVCYPPEHRDLYAAIARQGVLLSEAPPGMTPQARHFPRRNRLISGLSRGVVVVEANRRSGSLITARLALEQGREVFAVPGSPLDARAQGCNELIRQGAALTESAADVFAVLGRPDQPPAPARRPEPSPPPATLAPLPETAQEVREARDRVAALLSPTPMAVDEIVRTCQLSPALVSTILLEWELAGRLERHAGNRISVIP